MESYKKVSKNKIEELSKDMDGGPIADSLNSDNSFSDHGLENAQKLDEATQKSNS